MQGVAGTSVGNAERQRRYREKHPERVRAQRAAQNARLREDGYFRSWHLNRKYGLSDADVTEMLAVQGDCCAICKHPEPGGKGEWHVDHDHETGEVRGMLCFRCNVGLGNFADSQLRLYAAVEYLKRYEGKPLSVYKGRH